MILFIVIAVFILFNTTKELIVEVTAPGVSLINILKSMWMWFWANIVKNLFNVVSVWLISILVFFGLCFVCPSETSQWRFNINALQDNLVTEGRLYGRRGYVDGELSYFYSRTLSMGEKIEHIPADKTYVQYSDDERPHVEVHQSRVDIPDLLRKTFFIDWMNSKQTNYYVLVVPEGTITTTGEYTIDMK